ncbi:MAG: hypothetical protein QOH25_2920 [Acidobacteriota bacterium]|jgi:hypothetical protein|nr:hypothetical protein [Acidobacteriota bacterium]
MQSLSLHETAAQNTPPDLELEISKLEVLLAERRRELVALQEELRDFKLRYTQVVGSRLAELGEVESSIKQAEARLFDLETNAEGDVDETASSDDAQPSANGSGKMALRKLFWSVARLFHPDHAADEKEAQRRHEVMTEASRAYRAGDVESLHTLLGDEQLQFFCTGQSTDELEEDLAGRFLRLKGELSTIEFGIKRIRQDGLYRLKLKVDEDAANGRDALFLMAENINRQIVKARRRLEHLAG